MIWSKVVDEILSCGHSLAELGINNWALDAVLAMGALQALRENNVPVLGGDVYAIRGGLIEVTYDNWYCDRSPSESDLEFVERSIRKASAYVEGYSSRSGSDVLFAIVPGSQ
jgi:hypothetical protein